MKRISAATAWPMSAGAQYSAGLWLMPPRQRTNIIDAGQSLAIICPSCPAPDGMRIARAANIADGNGERILHAGVADRRRDVVKMFERHVELARGRNLARLGLKFRDRGFTGDIIHATQIDGEHRRGRG